MRKYINFNHSIVSLLLFLQIGSTGFTSYAAGENNKEFTGGVHALGSSDCLRQIGVEVFYYVPRDSKPLNDWFERIEYLMKRAQKFHRREFAGQSDFTYRIHEAPFIASVANSDMPRDDANGFYWYIINEVWNSGQAIFQTGEFPIILVFSDHNYSPSYDDWSRECSGLGCIFPEPHIDCAGYVRPDGEDRPGSRCGGARAVFWPQKHIGLGLVTADGWKTPLLGSDCVVYHEGIGHSIGLPHPEPINDSVMGLAQYVDGIHKTWIDDAQKEALGWQKVTVDKTKLFSNFNVEHSPHRPTADQPVQITATYPERYHDSPIQAEYQTSLTEPFQKLDPQVAWTKDGYYNVLWTIKPIELGKSIAYRVRIAAANGETEEIWHYYKIR